MDTTWGPALDAEVAYRIERLREDSLPSAGADWRRAGQRLLASFWRPAGAGVSAAAIERAPDRSARQRALTGSRAWPAAR